MSVISIMVVVHMNANLICSNGPSAFAQLVTSLMDELAYQQPLHVKSLPIWNANTTSGDATWKNGKTNNYSETNISVDMLTYGWTQILFCKK